MCGLVGVVAKSDVAPDIYDALTVLQHRGQDAAGIVTSDGNLNSASFHQTSYPAHGDASGADANYSDFGSSSYESSYRSSLSGPTGAIDTVFAAADTNNDGVLSQAEFQNAGF